MANYIMHHGVKGQRWGVRRYQNPDGTWKSGAGDAHRKAAFNRFQNGGSSGGKKASSSGDRVKTGLFKGSSKPKAPKKELTAEEKAARAERNKRIAKNILIAAGAVAVTSAVVYAGYKYKKNVDKMLEQNINLMMDESNRLNDKYLTAKTNYEHMLKNASYTDEQRARAKEVRDAFETLNYNKRDEVSRAYARNKGGVKISAHKVKEDAANAVHQKFQDVHAKLHGQEVYDRKAGAEKARQYAEERVLRARNTIDQNQDIVNELLGNIKADKTVYEEEWMNKFADQFRKAHGL